MTSRRALDGVRVLDLTQYDDGARHVEGDEKHTKREATEILAAAGVPCGAVLDSGEVPADEDREGVI